MHNGAQRPFPSASATQNTCAHLTPAAGRLRYLELSRANFELGKAVGAAELADKGPDLLRPEK